MRSDKVGRVRNAGCLVSSPINDACSLLGRQEQSGRSGGDGWKVNLNLNLKIKTFIYLFVCLLIYLTYSATHRRPVPSILTSSQLAQSIPHPCAEMRAGHEKDQGRHVKRVSEDMCLCVHTTVHA